MADAVLLEDDGPDLAAHPPVSGLRGWLGRPFTLFAEHDGSLAPLVVACFGTGIGLWFSWPHEPGLVMRWGAGGASLLGLLLWWRIAQPVRALGLLLAGLAVGFVLADLRAAGRTGPMLGFRYHGPVEGRVIELDRSASDAPRVTLDQVVLERMAPADTPGKVRVSLHGKLVLHDPAPGERVMLTAMLAPPEPAAEPGGFDFRRMAFFEELGAVGYSHAPLLRLAPSPWSDAWIARLRLRFANAIRAHVPGEAGAFAAGAMTGDRSAISQATVEALRDSSLSHILAISGMNLVFLISFVFALIRHGLACVPPLALRLETRKIAAGVSLAVAWFYLQLSGSNVATERAFVMVAVMLVAVMLDRRAITLCSVALAGAAILAWRPESLLAPGFQMSMAATVGLILGFDLMRRRLAGLSRVVAPLVTLALGSLIGGLATAPWVAFHFNRFADHGFLANLLTVPVIGFAIMPMGVLALLLSPLGLAWLPLWVMGQASAWILFVARHVAALEGAVTAIPAPPGGVLALLTLGGVLAALWPERLGKVFGMGGVLLALLCWPFGQRPLLLIAGDGRLAGLMGPEGRALSSGGGGGFSAQNWLENDGDLVDQVTAAARPGFSGPKGARVAQLPGVGEVWFLGGKHAAERVPEACAAAAWVITDARIETWPRGCALIDATVLRQTGALALHLEGDELVLHASREQGRIWHGKPMARDVLDGRLPPAIRAAFAQ